MDKTIALIAPIENSSSNLNKENGIHYNGERLFEEEAILCFENWRKNGGWLKDINIYVYCPTHNTITQKTKDRFNELGVIYTEKYHKETEDFNSGFINIPFVGMLYEKELSEDIFIKIDLDMNLIKPLPKELFEFDGIICGKYDKRSVDWDVVDPDNCYDTGFIISHRTDKFYELFYNETMKLINDGIDPDWQIVRDATGDYFLEEYVMEKIVKYDMFKVIPLEMYQIGEQYTSVSEFTDEQLKHVYFWHEHLKYDKKYYNRTKEKLLYKKWELRQNE